MQTNSEKIIKILAMSDTHDAHNKIDISTLPEADIFIHAGDFTQNSFRG
jgi:predicted phosphodiesterase